MKETNVISLLEQENPQCRMGVYSIIGHRDYQQDFAGLLSDSKGILAVVCDGMGGLDGGERASREAVQILFEDYKEKQLIENPSDFLLEEAARMDRVVYGLEKEDGSPLRAGSTVVAVFIRENKLYWMSVGDSRIYILRGDSMVTATRDHNYLRELEEALDRGDISQEWFLKEAATKKAEALTNYLGMGGLRRIEYNAKPFLLEEGDEVLLCSDGVYKSLDEHQIRAMLIDNRVSAQVSARRLVRMAMQQATRRQDNTTAVVLQYDKDKAEEEAYAAVL